MANAYDVMSMAKRQGAEVKAVENYRNYIKKVEAEEARASKAMSKGKIGGAFGGSIASYLAPAAIAALGVGTGGLGTMALSALIGGGISRGGTEIGDFLARQWTMGGKNRGKDFKAGNVGKMKGISGPYGQRRASELQLSGKDTMEGYKKTISEMLDIENTNRWISSGMSGLQTAGKVRGGLEGLGKDASMVDKMKAAMGGDVGSGYKLGAKDTGDFWQQKGIDRSLAKNIMTPNQLSPLAQQMSQDPSKAMSSYYQDTMGDMPFKKDVTDYFSGISTAEAPPAMTFAPQGDAMARSGMGRWDEPIDYFSGISKAEAPPSMTFPQQQGEGGNFFQGLMDDFKQKQYDKSTAKSIAGSRAMAEERFTEIFGEGYANPQIANSGRMYQAGQPISQYQVGQPRKSLTLLQQLLQQGGR